MSSEAGTSYASSVCSDSYQTAGEEMDEDDEEMDENQQIFEEMLENRDVFEEACGNPDAIEEVPASNQDVLDQVPEDQEFNQEMLENQEIFEEVLEDQEILEEYPANQEIIEGAPQNQEIIEENRENLDEAAEHQRIFEETPQNQRTPAEIQRLRDDSDVEEWHDTDSNNPDEDFNAGDHRLCYYDTIVSEDCYERSMNACELLKMNNKEEKKEESFNWMKEVPLILMGATTAADGLCEGGASSELIDKQLRHVTNDYLSFATMVDFMAPNDPACREDMGKFLVRDRYADSIAAAGHHFSLEKRPICAKQIARTRELKMKKEALKLDQAEQPENKRRLMHVNNMLVTLMQRHTLKSGKTEIEWQTLQKEYEDIFLQDSENVDLFEKFKDDLNLQEVGPFLDGKACGLLFGRSGPKKGLSLPIFRSILIKIDETSTASDGNGAPLVLKLDDDIIEEDLVFKTDDFDRVSFGQPLKDPRRKLNSEEQETSTTLIETLPIQEEDLLVDICEAEPSEVFNWKSSDDSISDFDEVYPDDSGSDLEERQEHWTAKRDKRQAKKGQRRRKRIARKIRDAMLAESQKQQKSSAPNRPAPRSTDQTSCAPNPPGPRSVVTAPSDSSDAIVAAPQPRQNSVLRENAVLESDITSSNVHISSGFTEENVWEQDSTGSVEHQQSQSPTSNQNEPFHQETDVVLPNSNRRAPESSQQHINTIPGGSASSGSPVEGPVIEQMKSTSPISNDSGGYLNGDGYGRRGRNDGHYNNNNRTPNYRGNNNRNNNRRGDNRNRNGPSWGFPNKPQNFSGMNAGCTVQNIFPNRSFNSGLNGNSSTPVDTTFGGEFLQEKDRQRELLQQQQKREEEEHIYERSPGKDLYYGKPVVFERPEDRAEALRQDIQQNREPTRYETRDDFVHQPSNISENGRSNGSVINQRQEQQYYQNQQSYENRVDFSRQPSINPDNRGNGGYQQHQQQSSRSHDLPYHQQQQAYEPRNNYVPSNVGSPMYQQPQQFYDQRPLDHRSAFSQPQSRGPISSIRQEEQNHYQQQSSRDFDDDRASISSRSVVQRSPNDYGRAERRHGGPRVARLGASAVPHIVLPSRVDTTPIRRTELRQEQSVSREIVDQQDRFEHHIRVLVYHNRSDVNISKRKWSNMASARALNPSLLYGSNWVSEILNRIPEVSIREIQGNDLLFDWN